MEKMEKPLSNSPFMPFIQQTAIGSINLITIIEFLLLSRKTKKNVKLFFEIINSYYILDTNSYHLKLT